MDGSGGLAVASGTETGRSAAALAVWQATVLESLKGCGVRTFVHVPDLVLAGLIRLAEAAADCAVYAPAKEEEGIGILCGAYLGGRQGVMLMQNSGAGNVVNALASLA